MIWYYLYMGLLILTLLIWVAVAIKPATSAGKTPESASDSDTLDFRKDR